MPSIRQGFRGDKKQNVWSSTGLDVAVGGPADYDSERALLAAVLIADNDFAASDLNDRGPGNHGIRAVNADSKVLEPGVTTDRQSRD